MRVMNDDSHYGRIHSCLTAEWFCWKTASGLGKILCEVLINEKNMDSCTGSHNLADIMLKLALDILQTNILMYVSNTIVSDYT